MIKPANFRKSLGNMTELRESIRKNGIERPIIVTPDGLVLSGTRRLRACYELGLADPPSQVVDNLNDACEAIKSDGPGLPMKPSEMVELSFALEDLDAESLAEFRVRQGEALSAGLPSPKRGSQQRVIADTLGLSYPSLYRMRKVLLTASDNSSPFQKVAIEGREAMDEKGKAFGAYEKLRKAKKKAGDKRGRGRPAKDSHRAERVTQQAWQILHHLDSATGGLIELDFDLMDTDGMEQMVSDSLHNLGAFQRRLKKGK